MIFQETPQNGLSKWLDLVWYVEKEFEQEAVEDRIFATGQMHLVFNFGEDYFLLKEGKKVKMPRITLAGHFENPVVLVYPASICHLGVVMRPTTFYKLFHRISSLFTDAFIDGQSVPQLKELYPLLKDMEGMDQKKDLLLDYLASLLKNQSFDSILDEMIDYLEIHCLNFDVKSMAQHFNYSVSGLERVFKRNFGITPKAYANLVRFRLAMKKEDPTQLFYDQSHFIKACKRYTGKSPEALRNSDELTLKQMLDWG